MIDKTYKSIRHRYWYSSVILPEEREFNNVFLFERTDEELSWLTTDGYNFVVPAAVVQGGFFTAIRGGSLLFHDLVKTLNRIKINLNSRVLYFLLSARKLDLEHKLSYESQEAESHLFDVATRLNDKELFDALKICNIVTINEANILIPLHYAITAVLLGRYPLKKIVGMIELELDLSAAWGDPLDDYKKLMSISLRKLVGAVLNIDFYKHSQKHVEEATMQQVEPAGDSKKKKKEKKVSIARRIQPGRKVKDQPILV
ncbi:hypothetical protein FJ364_01890 [Candidatus Dependentiae bacterium]|nr:hypothetical protein [Candidatus Dependentiae bacterium]